MDSTSPQQNASSNSPENIPAPQTAGFFSRFEAFVIDLVILSLVQLVGSAFIQTMIEFFRLSGVVTRIQSLLADSRIEFAAGVTLMTLLVILYFVFFWTLVGYTPGKAILGLRVVRTNGSKLSYYRSLVRFFSYWVSAIPIFLGFFWVLWDSKRQGWHDKVAGTLVVYTHKKVHK
jgi:uncharacterized RDD family membrane protein YckC